MGTTLNIRTDPVLRERLERRAKVQGKTVSAVARAILEDALDERPLRLRIGHLKGRLKLDREWPWRDALRQRNQRP